MMPQHVRSPPTRTIKAVFSPVRGMGRGFAGAGRPIATDVVTDGAGVAVGYAGTGRALGEGVDGWLFGADEAPPAGGVAAVLGTVTARVMAACLSTDIPVPLAVASTRAVSVTLPPVTSASVKVNGRVRQVVEAPGPNVVCAHDTDAGSPPTCKSTRVTVPVSVSSIVEMKRSAVVIRPSSSASSQRTVCRTSILGLGVAIGTVTDVVAIGGVDAAVAVPIATTAFTMG